MTVQPPLTTNPDSDTLPLHTPVPGLTSLQWPGPTDIGTDIFSLLLESSDHEVDLMLKGASGYNDTVKSNVSL